MKKGIIIFFLLAFQVMVCAQSPENIWLHPNKGQWEDIILHKLDLAGGDMFITRKGMTFHFHNAGELSHKHTEQEDDHDEILKGQVITYNFLGANYLGQTQDFHAAPFYDNYYLGNDPTKWKSEIFAVQESRLVNFLPGIDMIYSGDQDALKYTLELAPNVDVTTIQAEISGADKLSLLKNGGLSIQHRFGIIHESKPIAWQIIDKKRISVEVAFRLSGNQLGYTVGNYDPNYPLVIDPNLTFSSFSGSTADNWGSTATPDSQGNVFGGGICFSSGYPTTTGAYDNSYNGSGGLTTVDVVITKFNSSGSSLLYSTYLGGSSSEFPSSMICGLNGELYVLGFTGSSNFPMVNGFDVTYNGGPAFTKYTMNYNGSDIFVARFNPNGTAILSSTYLGGSQNDGVNDFSANYNYGDGYRGEISLDANYNVFITSSTLSNNFPLAGAGGQFFQGSQCAVALKLNQNLNNLLWSRYISGTGSEAGMSIQLASNGDVYVAGGTNSPSLGFSGGASNANSGGMADGFVMKLNGANGATLGGTFIGTNEYDYAFFVQLDVNDEPYILGQSTASYAITPGKYGTPNSGLFIRKFTNNLSTVLWTTMIGAGSGTVEISPTAFLVSDCFDIYVAGWGGPLNNQLGQGNGSTTTGFTVTSDAYQPTTTGNDFYLCVLGNNANALKYATFMGGNSGAPKHVDGGTSRFDKSGRVYHAVCAACGGLSNGFTTTPGAWSTTNNSFNCNMAVFKFDLSIIVPLINVLDPLICYPEPVVFQNLTVNANIFNWAFGDGTFSNVQSPSHVYPGPGTYTVTLIASDSAGCYVADTSTYIIDIGDFQGGVVQPIDTICPGESYQMQASGGGTYQWSPPQFLDNPNSATPIATVSTTTIFTVIITDSCGADTLTATLNVYNDTPSASNDTTLCIGQNANLWAAGGDIYTWSPSTYLNNPNIATPLCSPDSTITYDVTIETLEGCIYQEQVTVTVFYNAPVPIIDDTVKVCAFTSKILQVGGADTYAWDPSPFINPQIGPTVTISPVVDQYFVCSFINACATVKDSIYAHIIHPNVNGFGDTTICPGDIAILWATGGIDYEWFPQASSVTNNGSLVHVRPNVNTVYRVIGQDNFGCYDTAFVNVQLYPQPTVSTNVKVFAIIGDIVELNAVGSPAGGSYQWFPPDYLSCPTCATTDAIPNADFLYDVIYTDLNSCQAKGGVQILYDASIFIPNTFTPDGDAFNGIFSVVPVNVRTFRLDIYDRWGELIHVMTESTNYWDGTFNGRKSPDGVYTWKIVYYDLYEKAHQRTGHITILR